MNWLTFATTVLLAIAGPTAAASQNRAYTPDDTWDSRQHTWAGAPVGTCDASLAKHVYHPARLQMITPCITVSGVIRKTKTEPDGDVHIQLRLDPQFKHLLNARNLKAQAGNLVLEPICVKPVKQVDAIAACKGVHNTVLIPKKGDKVSVTGVYVQDNESNHGWREIHAVSEIKVIP